MIPIFRKGPGPYALAEAMAGVRLGNRLLFLGTGEARLFAALAAKVGLTGRSRAIVDSDASRVEFEAAAARSGVLVEVAIAGPPAFDLGEREFDLVVIDASGGFVLRLAAEERVDLARQALEALRDGGRVVVFEREPGGLRTLFQGRPGGLAEFAASGGAPALLETAGFRPVRLLGDREHQRFTEGWKGLGRDRTS